MPSPKPPTQAESDKEDVRRLLFEHSPPYSEQYEAWADRHPIMSGLTELGLQYGLSELPFGTMFRAIGMNHVADIIKMSEKVGSGLPEGWKGGSEALPKGGKGDYANPPAPKIPRKGVGNYYDFDRPYNITEEGDKELSHLIDIYHRNTDQRSGTILGHPSDDGKNFHISAAEKENNPGTPSELMLLQTLSMRDQLVEHYPKLETVSVRDKGGGVKSYPIDLPDRGQYRIGGGQISREMEQGIIDWYEHVDVWKDIEAPKEIEYALWHGGDYKPGPSEPEQSNVDEYLNSLGNINAEDIGPAFLGK